MGEMSSGRRRKLTPKQTDELAREAEAGYDLSKARRERLPRGRPSLQAGLSPRISYRLGGDLYQKARKRAAAEGRTVSEVAREALERYVS